MPLIVIFIYFLKIYKCISVQPPCKSGLYTNSLDETWKPEFILTADGVARA